MNMNQKQLLMYIDQVSFAIDDLILFLDTHPCDKDALDYYQKLRKMRKEAVRQYTTEFGPLTITENENECYWDWVKTPWPWEC
ncbi:MAG: spore coat protein CotJB [Clostridiaceae bacterium]|nr:spore coat protein CotJB [Clostridiaceae bacterium]